MRVLVAIPWRSHPDRVYAYNLTVTHYRRLLPTADIVAVDTDHEPFCLAACRNRGVRIAETGGYDLAILGTADTLPEQAPLLTAFCYAISGSLVLLPYTEHRSLSATGTVQHRAGGP